MITVEAEKNISVRQRSSTRSINSTFRDEKRTSLELTKANLDNRDETKTKDNDDDGGGGGGGGGVELPRNIGLFGGIAFVIGSIIGSGIFIAPKGVAIGSGSVGLSMISWTACGIISMLGAFCYAELGTVVKKSGADYVYLNEAYGSVFSYTFALVSSTLVKPASMATVTLTCAQYIMTLVFNDGCGEAPMYVRKLAAIFFLLVLAGINSYSTRLASQIQIIFTVGKLTALVIIIVGGIYMLCTGHTTNISRGFEYTNSNPGKVAVGLYSGMWAYDGWNTANYMTEEIINPERNLPLSIVIGVPLVMVVYLLTNISYFTVMSVEELIASPAVAVTWAETVIPRAAWLIPIFVAMSTFGAGNGILCSGGRLMFSAARNEHLPDVLGMVHVKKCTPAPAIMLTTVIAIIFVMLGEVGRLIDFISFILWGFYGLNMLAVILFRFVNPYKDVPRPIKIPLIIPALVLIASVFLVFVPIITNPRIEFLFAAVFIAAGFIFFVPFVVFKLRFRCTKHVTTFFQLYLQVLKPKDI